MKLIFDIGNTNVVCAVFRGNSVIASFRLQSDRGRTEDEFSLEVLSLLQHHHIDRNEITRVIIGSVVPQLTRAFSLLSTKYFDQFPLVIKNAESQPMELRVDSPLGVGADQIANAYAARELYGAPCLIIDFGTATTIDVVGKSGAYEGGIIAPGLMISAEALFSRTALLRSVEIQEPARVIGTNSKDAMLSGILLGYASLIEGMVQRISKELGCHPTVIATGGLSPVIAKHTECIQTIDPDLTLNGFRMIAEQMERSS